MRYLGKKAQIHLQVAPYHYVHLIIRLEIIENNFHQMRKKTGLIIHLGEAQCKTVRTYPKGLIPVRSIQGVGKQVAVTEFLTARVQVAKGRKEGRLWC